MLGQALNVLMVFMIIGKIVNLIIVSDVDIWSVVPAHSKKGHDVLRCWNYTTTIHTHQCQWLACCVSQQGHGMTVHIFLRRLLSADSFSWVCVPARPGQISSCYACCSLGSVAASSHLPQWSLCCGQSSFWHLLEQYLAVWPISLHLSHNLVLTPPSTSRVSVWPHIRQTFRGTGHILQMVKLRCSLYGLLPWGSSQNVMGKHRHRNTRGLTNSKIPCLLLWKAASLFGNNSVGEGPQERTYRK